MEGKRNELIDFIESAMISGRIMFNKSSTNTNPQNCKSFTFIPIQNYDEMVNDCIYYFRNIGFLVTNNGVIIEINRI